jgi:hypothetical protein
LNIVTVSGFTFIVKIIVFTFPGGNMLEPGTNKLISVLPLNNALAVRLPVATGPDFIV